MPFERTAGGQANRALFFRTDLICYTEGDSESEIGIDIAFWCGVFESLAPNLSIHFTARGGKAVLEGLAAEIARDGISNTIVAMDRDYSQFRGDGLIDHPSVFYTHGYSWENDVYSPEQAKAILRRLCRASAVPPDHLDHLAEDASRLERGCRSAVIADFAALLRGGSVFDREKPGKYVCDNSEGRPGFARDRCLVDVKAAREALKGRAVRDHTEYPKEGARFLWGKTFEHYVRLGIQKSMRAICGRAATPDHIRDIGITCFSQCLATGQNSEVLDHYRNMWDRFAPVEAP